MGHSAIRADDTMLLKSLAKSNLCLIFRGVFGRPKALIQSTLKNAHKEDREIFESERMTHFNRSLPRSEEEDC